MGPSNRALIIRLAALAALALAGVTADAAAHVNVGLNQSLRLAVHGAAANVVVANSAIADVTVVDAHSVIVMGKGYGTTQILVLDSTGHSLLDTAVSVTAPSEDQLTLYRGTVPQQYSCTPRCEADKLHEPGPTSSAASGAPPSP